MEEREWVQRADRPIAFHARKTSRDYGWRGFDAVLWDASDGYSDDYFEDHSISMHVGTPVIVTSRCDDQRVHRLQVPGDIKVVPAGYSRIWEISAPTSKLTIGITPWFMHETAASLGLNGDSIAIAPQLHVKDARLERICWGLLDELQSDVPLGRLYAESLGCALAVGLLKNFAPKVPPRPAGMPKRRLTRVLDYIRENVARDLSLAELAGVASVSPSHFKVLFKTAVGVPVHQYVINTRVDRALKLLVHSDVPLADIALQAGFANQSHLSRHMRRLHGVSPATIRRQSR